MIYRKKKCYHLLLTLIWQNTYLEIEYDNCYIEAKSNFFVILDLEYCFKSLALIVILRLNLPC